MPHIDLAMKTFWNADIHRELRKTIREFSPDVIHFHNTFPILSPSGYYAAKKENIPVIQTLHNFRLSCLNGLFLRENNICEDCLGKPPWLGIVRKCYRSNFAASSILAGMVIFHRMIRTWQTQIDRFIVLNQFSRKKFIEIGLPAEKLMVKPNFIHAKPTKKSANPNYALFIGRLSPEKGIEVLLNAWKKHRSGSNLLIAGSGPLESRVRQACLTDHTIQYIGQVPAMEIFPLHENAKFLIFPSICYENQPLVLLESLAAGTPIIASKQGGIPEIIQHEKTGLLFKPGNTDELAHLIDRVLSSKEESMIYSKNARDDFQKRFSPEINYEKLMMVYDSVQS